MGGWGEVMLYSRARREVDVPNLCNALRAMGIPEPIDSVIWRRYPGRTLERLRKLNERADEDLDVWDEMFEISDQIQSVFHQKVPLDLVPDLVRAERCWNLTFFGYPFERQLPDEWAAVPESVRGKANAAGTAITIGPHVLPVILPDDSNLASVRVLEASFSMHFSGYPASNESVDAMKSLPTLQLVRKHLEPVLGPLDIEARWFF